MVNFSSALPLFAVLVLFTVTVFALLRTDLSLTHAEAYVLFGLYGLFLLWLAAEAADVTSLLPEV